MPDEPLIFVEVALTKGDPGSIQALLAEDRDRIEARRRRYRGVLFHLELPEGAAGISFGNS
jgi:malonyl-CoA decarboxylase